jgi:hypothetical protein
VFARESTERPLALELLACPLKGAVHGSDAAAEKLGSLLRLTLAFTTTMTTTTM